MSWLSKLFGKKIIPTTNGVSVRDLYNRNPEKEFYRTQKDAASELEFLTTEYHYKKYLKPGMRVLDAGGGPGRYTLEFAKMGCYVTLADIADKELDFARGQINDKGLNNFVDSVDNASITDLPYKANSFDAVFCVGGPLSHVRTPKERAKAVAELIRVAKPGAPIFISVMGRPAVLNLFTKDWKDYLAEYDYKSGEDFWNENERLAYSGDDLWFVGCSYAHFFWPTELRELVMKTNKVSFLNMVGLEWSRQNCKAEFNEFMSNATHREKWMNIHYKLSDHPDIVALSPHIMIIVRKKRATSKK